MNLFSLLDQMHAELESARGHLDQALDDYHAELDQLATMRDVDDCLLMLAGDSDPGPFLERLRREQFDRRHRVRREGNVLRVEFRFTPGGTGETR